MVVQRCCWYETVDDPSTSLSLIEEKRLRTWAAHAEILLSIPSPWLRLRLLRYNSSLVGGAFANDNREEILRMGTTRGIVGGWEDLTR